jgi:transposase
MGHLTMSSKEARRPGLVQAALAGKVTNGEAARALGLGVRQFRRLKAAYRRSGVAGLLHGNRGRRAPNRLADAERERIVALINSRFTGLNDSHLTEKLREIEGLDVCRETIRRLRQAAGIAPVRRRRAPGHRRRRLREARRGALVLVDASEHHWFGAPVPRWDLLGALDDATGAILALHFRPDEDLHGYTHLLRDLVTRHGLPCTLYGDRLGVFVRNDDHWTIAEELAGQQRPTQFGEMLAELAIGYIPAHSPQAKGRIERLWETLQDRLVAELRLRRIVTVAAAEAYLPEFIADFNRRFAHPARDTVPAWRRTPRDLDRVLACRYARVVARDNTVTLPGRWIQIPPGPGRRSWHTCRVEVRELLDGRLQVFHHARLIAEQPWDSTPFTLMPRDSHPRRRSRLGIDLPGSPRKLDPSVPRLTTQPRNTAIGHLTNIRRPASDHPWQHTPRPQPGRISAGGEDIIA